MKLLLQRRFLTGQKIPLQKLTEGETKRLARLEKELHKRVIGQNEAVKAVAQAVKRGRVGLKIRTVPLVLSFP